MHPLDKERQFCERIIALRDRFGHSTIELVGRSVSLDDIVITDLVEDSSDEEFIKEVEARCRELFRSDITDS